MKILIELPTWLGDTVMTTPAIENLIHHFKDTKITLIGSFASIEVLKNHPNVDKVLIIKKGYFYIYKLTKKLGKFQHFFSFRSSYRSKIIKLLVDSDHKYQFSKTKYQEKHQVEKYNNFINDCINQNFPAKNLTIYQANKLLISNKRKVVGINPGATYGSSKRWYPEEFAQVAIELSPDYDIIIFGGRGEINLALDIEKLLIEKGIQNYKNLAGKTTIEELVTKISNLDLFITADSGPMHLAASFQIPTVAIFGPTNVNETSQWKLEKSIIVKNNLECQPCMKRTCPLKHHNCMKFIKALDVLKAVESIV
jgi:heptosyltransferase II